VQHNPEEVQHPTEQLQQNGQTKCSQEVVEKQEIIQDRQTSIVGSAAPDKRLHRAEQLHDPNHQAFDQSGMYSKSSNVADMVIEAQDRCRGLDGEVGIGWGFGHNRRGKACGGSLWIA
jgi:hypothetical protein